MDESPKKLIAETKISFPLSRWQPVNHDYEYGHCGVYNIFLASELLAGKSMVTITERKSKRDWACLLEESAD